MTEEVSVENPEKESKQIGNTLMFQILRMEAEEEGFVEVLFCQTKYGIWNNLSFCFFRL